MLPCPMSYDGCFVPNKSQVATNNLGGKGEGHRVPGGLCDDMIHWCVAFDLVKY